MEPENLDSAGTVDQDDYSDIQVHSRSKHTEDIERSEEKESRNNESEKGKDSMDGDADFGYFENTEIRESFVTDENAGNSAKSVE